MSRLILKAKIWIVIVGVVSVLKGIAYIDFDHLSKQKAEMAKQQCIKDVIGKRQNHQPTSVENHYCEGLGNLVYEYNMHHLGFK